MAGGPFEGEDPHQGYDSDGGNLKGKTSTMKGKTMTSIVRDMVELIEDKIKHQVISKDKTYVLIDFNETTFIRTLRLAPPNRKI